jgi:predicted nuclease of predicted toxin-antitoxin system
MVRLYMDENVHGAVTKGLLLRGVNVLTAQEDGRDNTPDAQVLDRASDLGRVLVTYDDDLLREARSRQTANVAFAGVIYAHQNNIAPGQCIEDLELIATLGDPAEFAGRVQYLPL